MKVGVKVGVGEPGIGVLEAGGVGVVAPDPALPKTMGRYTGVIWAPSAREIQAKRTTSAVRIVANSIWMLELRHTETDAQA